jgi:hypothetical protein
MRFADLLPAPAVSSGAPRPPHVLRRSLVRAGAGLAGLLLLPLLSGGASVGPGLRMIAALGAVCALAWGSLRLLARRGVAAGVAPVRVVGKAALSPKAAVAVVEADGQRLVLAYGDGFATLLSTTPSSPGEPR